MVHLGDITKMSGYTIPPVDVITLVHRVKTSPSLARGPVWPGNDPGCFLRPSASSAK